MNNEELEDDDYEYLCATVGCKNALDYCNEYCTECDKRNRNRILEKPTRLCTTFGCEKEAEINDFCRACYQLNECQYESINDTQYYEKKRENVYEKIGNFPSRKPDTKKKSFLAANSESTKPKIEIPKKEIPKIEIPFRSFDGVTESTSIVTTNELKDDMTYDTALIGLDYKLSDTNLRDSTTFPSSTKQNLLCAYSGCGHDAIRDNTYCSNHTRTIEKMNNNSIQCIVQGCTNMRTGELLICEDCNKEQEGDKRLPYPIGLPKPSGDTIFRTDRSQVPDVSKKCQFCGKTDVCANGFCTEYDQIQALTQQCPLCENYTVRSDGFCEDCYQNQVVANERLTTRNETNNALNPTMLCMTEGCDKTTRSIDELICTECSKEQEVALKEFKRLLEPPPLPPKLRSTSAPTLTLNSVLSSTDDNPNNSSTLSFEISATHRANDDAPELTVKSSLSVTNPFKNNTNTSNEEIRSKSEPGIFHSQNIKRKTEIAPNYFSSENEPVEESKSSPLPFPRNFLQAPRSSFDIHRSVPLPSSNRPKPNLQDLFNLPEDTISSKNRSHSSPSLNLQALAKTLPPIPTQSSTLSHMNRPLEVKCRGMSSSEHVDHSLSTTMQTIDGSPATPVITDISSIKLEEVLINARQGNYRLNNTTSAMPLRMNNLDGRTPALYRSLSLKENQYPLNTSSQQTNGERNKDSLVVDPTYRPVESGIPTSLPRQLSIPLIPTVPLSPIDITKSAPLLPRAFDISSIGPPLPKRNPIAQTLNLPGRPPPPIPPHPTVPLNPHEGLYSTRYISQRHPPPQHPPPPMIYYSNASNRNAPPPPSVTVTTLPPPRRQTSTLRSLSYPSFESLRQFGSMTSLNPPSLDMNTNQRNSLPESLTFHSLEEHPEETQPQDRNSPPQTQRVNEENNSTNLNTENPSSPSSLYYEVPEGIDFDEFIGDEGGYDVLSNQFNNDICKQPDCHFFGSQDFDGFCSSCHKKDIAKKSAEQLALSKETDDKVCIICVQNEYNTVVLPCGHLYFCYECAETLKRHGDCPICRRRIKSIHRVYKPN